MEEKRKDHMSQDMLATYKPHNSYCYCMLLPLVYCSVTLASHVCLHLVVLVFNFLIKDLVADRLAGTVDDAQLDADLPRPGSVDFVALQSCSFLPGVNYVSSLLSEGNAQNILNVLV
jgi:hypothetical protein